MQPFSEEARRYLEILCKQYRLLLSETTDPRGKALLARFDDIEQHPEQATWADIATVEAAYLYALPEYRLRSELRSYSSRYRAVAGYNSDPLPRPEGRENPAELRAELLSLAERIAYLYTFVPTWEATQNKLGIAAMLWTVLLTLLCGSIAYETSGLVRVIAYIVLLGLFGGFLSAQQRIRYSANGGEAGRTDPLIASMSTRSGWFSIVIEPPLLGAIFAIILYEVFIGGFLKGGAFPVFLAPDTQHPLNEAFPAASADWAKLGIWSFLVGFAERFVPDVLTRLAAGQAQRLLPASQSKSDTAD